MGIDARIVTNNNFDAGHERAITTTDEADQLQDAVFHALQAYADYLDRHGLIWNVDANGEPSTLKADRLVACIDFRTTEEVVGPVYEIGLEGSALDRLYR